MENRDRVKAEMELAEELQRQERENDIKVRDMLQAKLNGNYGGETAKPITYEDYKNKGDIMGMLYHKLGIAEKQERARRLAGMMENIDITKTMSDLKIIEGNINILKQKINNEIEREKTELAQAFRYQGKGLLVGVYSFRK